MFDHHHRVSASGHHATRGDDGCSAGLHGNRRGRAASKHLAVEAQTQRGLVRCPHRIRGTHGKAVDRGAIEGRKIDRRSKILGHDPAGRLSQGHRLVSKGFVRHGSTETAFSLLAGDHVEELLLSRRAADFFKKGRVAHETLSSPKRPQMHDLACWDSLRCGRNEKPSDRTRQHFETCLREGCWADRIAVGDAEEELVKPNSGARLLGKPNGSGTDRRSDAGY